MKLKGKGKTNKIKNEMKGNSKGKHKTNKIKMKLLGEL